jgi:hypothetical protein
MQRSVIRKLTLYLIPSAKEIEVVPERDERNSSFMKFDETGFISLKNIRI